MVMAAACPSLQIPSSCWIQCNSFCILVTCSRSQVKQGVQTATTNNYWYLKNENTLVLHPAKQTRIQTLAPKTQIFSIKTNFKSTTHRPQCFNLQPRNTQLALSPKFLIDKKHPNVVNKRRKHFQFAPVFFFAPLARPYLPVYFCSGISLGAGPERREAVCY